MFDFKAKATGGDNVKFAVVTITLTVLALSLGDAFIKQVSAGFSLWQIFILRSVIAVPILILIIKAFSHSVSLKPSHTSWVILRSLMLTLMWVAYYTALPHVALSVAAAAYYTTPIFITLFAALFINDKVGIPGWAAILLGFCGILLILKPQSDDFNAYALLPLVSAVLYALAMIITRTQCKNENPLVLSLTLNMSFIGVGVLATLLLELWNPPSTTTASYPFLLGQWTLMGMGEWFTMSLLAIVIIIGSVGGAIAYQAAPSAIVATFDFSYVAFAAVWGFLFFIEVPDYLSVIGMLLIISGGVLAVRQKQNSN